MQGWLPIYATWGQMTPKAVVAYVGPKIIWGGVSYSVTTTAGASEFATAIRWKKAD